MRDRRNTNLSTFSDSSNNSSGSSRDSLNEKRYSSPPLPSLILPLPVTKENHSRTSTRSKRRMALRILGAICGVAAVWHFVFARLCSTSVFHSSVDYEALTGSDPAPIDALPDEPSALLVLDQKGHSRWTVSTPGNYSFPLRSRYYEDICRQGEVLRNSIARDSRVLRAKDWRQKDSYYFVDHAFIEPEKARTSGALPSSKHETDVTVCERSLTFVLDTDDASFGKSLLALWLSYGLAKKEGRAFFIDDTRWPYGRYATYFAPPPLPACSRPHPQQIVPCPHSAKHLVVSAATVPWTFGPAFDKEYSPPRRYGAERSHPIFNLLRTGYDALFHLTGEDVLYATSRIARFKEEAHQHSGSVVGMHVRRGDLHPLEYQYSQDYLPLERYSSAARKILRTRLSMSLPDGYRDVDDLHAFSESISSPLLLASDDPEMFTSTELKDAAAPFEVQHAQERIQLATKATLDLASPAVDVREPGSAYVKHVDENAGWEGGFYSSLFFTLGRSKAASNLGRLSRFQSNGEDNDETLSDETKRMRELIGRAYLLDLAVLGKSDGVVCAVSSASCRILGVMMGWDAVRDGRWVNVDDGRQWSWNGLR